MNGKVLSEDVNGSKLEVSTNYSNALSLYLTGLNQDSEKDENATIRYVVKDIKEAESIISFLQEWVKIESGNWTAKQLNGKVIK
jgi:hypothetical protein